MTNWGDGQCELSTPVFTGEILCSIVERALVIGNAQALLFETSAPGIVT